MSVDEDVADLLQRTRVDRGLPLKVEDPWVLARIAEIVSPGSKPTHGFTDQEWAKRAALENERRERERAANERREAERQLELAQRRDSSAVLARPEAIYRDEVAAVVRGRIEQTLGLCGRCDVLTESHVFEVEPASRWKHGLRQVLAYAAGAEGRMPCLAVYGAWGAEGEAIYLELRDSGLPVELWLRSKSARWRRVTSRAEAKLTN